MPARVLVIDDSAMAAELLARALTAQGVESVFATDLATLDIRLTEARYELIVVDVNMPEMYGDDVVEFLREQRKVDAKLVLYSDVSEAELAKKTKASGADGFVTKSRGLEAAVAELTRLVKPIPVASPAPSPSPEAPAAPAAPVAAPAAEGAPRTRRVLIVDDSEVTMTVLAAELSAKGFEVSTADSSDKATKIILKKQTRPDLVLLDVRMPNVNGEQFCRFIKSNSLFSGIKVLLCSGESIEELQRICREAGADGYLPKDQVLAKMLARELG
jgi:CheY-like chemotaxis protein